MDRRSFLSSILALGAAPAIVRADSLMRIVPRETLVEVPGSLYARLYARATFAAPTADWGEVFIVNQSWDGAQWVTRFTAEQRIVHLWTLGL